MTAVVERGQLAQAATSFELPDELSAGEPPEARGLARDGVRLLVSSPDRTEHVVFRDIGSFLRPGDLLVVNTSGTLAAAVDGWRSGSRGAVTVHFSSAGADGAWVVELRLPGGSGPMWDASVGEEVGLPGGAGLILLGPSPERSETAGNRQSAGNRQTAGNRLWRARLDAGSLSVHDYLARRGRPISYGYLRGRWPIEMYQPIFAHDLGSAEMASAGRPFTTRLVTDLVAAGVVVAPITLHAGVSSQEAYEPPQSEWFRVPATTARLVRETKRAGGRVVAVGTTVTRALESAVRADGSLIAAEGWTDLVLAPGRPARVIDGLVTGWHQPQASHLLLLEAVAGPDIVGAAYSAALREGYLWHEFGDSALLLPDPRAR
jgi:S-adenosylmethionine:tRNA ribosyltransferase-isomerase